MGIAFAVTAIGLILVCYGTLMPRLLRKVQIRRFRRNPAAREKMNYQVFDDQITVASSMAYSEVRWQAFVKVKETASYICLYVSTITAYLIPLANLTPNQSSQLRELARSRIQTASVPGRSFFRRS